MVPFYLQKRTLPQSPTMRRGSKEYSKKETIYALDAEETKKP